MTLNDDLTLVDSWLALPFREFAFTAIREMQRRFLGIAGHSDLLAIALSNENSGHTPIPYQIKTIGSQALEFLSRTQNEIRTQEIAQYNRQQQSDFLRMLVGEIRPIVNKIDGLIAQVHPNESQTNIASAVWNIQKNNLLRLRHLLHVCGK